MSQYGNYQSELKMIKNHPASQKVKYEEIERAIESNRQAWINGPTRRDKNIAALGGLIFLLIIITCIYFWGY